MESDSGNTYRCNDAGDPVLSDRQMQVSKVYVQADSREGDSACSQNQNPRRQRVCLLVSLTARIQDKDI